MNTTALAKPTADLTNDPSYLKLRRDAARILAKGRARAETAVKGAAARTYWELGKRINRDLLKNQKRAGYGQQIFPALSRDMNLSKSVLYDASRLARVHPIFPAQGNLTWAPLRRLLAVQDPQLREVLAQEAGDKNWKLRQLNSKITQIRKGNSAARFSKKAEPLFKPRRGELNTYRVAYPTKNSKALALDLGFYTFRELTVKQAAKYTEGTLVETRQDAELHPSRAPKNALYTYTAELERVIDGDTLWMKIDLGFGVVARKKLRLRAIDTPEMETAAGRRAKKWVEETLLPHASLIVTTTKPDKYDRYLSDIWLGEINLNQLLLKENLARIKTSYRLDEWEK